MNYDLSKIKAIAGAAQVGSVKVYPLIDQTIPLRKTDCSYIFNSYNPFCDVDPAPISR
jgi:hypothetical protein